MRSSRLWPAVGAILGGVIVVSSMVATHPSWGLISHTECQVGADLGNVSIWVPNSVVAAPYHGSVSGTTVIWEREPGGSLSFSFPYDPVLDGNVTAFVLGYENWTIYSQQNVTHLGPGRDDPCASSLIAYYSPNAVEGLRHGGTSSWPMYTNLVSDMGLPSGLNGSALCAQVENTSNLACGVGAQFDINFERATGVVDTCGLSEGKTLPIFSDRWPVTAPFFLNGQVHAVPLNPAGADPANYANGTYTWYNYTFPANGGIWQYDDLSQTSSTGAGLVFSYERCS